MTNNKSNDLFVGNTGIVNNNYILSSIELGYISGSVKTRVNKTIGKVSIGGVGDVLIREIFENKRKTFGQVIDGERTLFEQIADVVIDIISVDAISFYLEKDTNSKRTIWNSVDRSNSQNVNGQGMINKRGVYGSSVALRF